MDNQNPEAPKQPSPPRPVPQPQNPQRIKVLQPTEAIVKEVAANPESYYSKNLAPQSIAPIPTPSPGTQPVQPEANASRPDPTAIPLEMQGHHPPGSSTDLPVDDPTQSLNFKSGYSMGSAIFWFQLLAGIVLNVIFSGINSSMLRGASPSLAALVGFLYHILELAVLFYIPYSVLKAGFVKDPFWLSLFGGGIEILIISGFLALLDLFIVYVVISHGASFSLTHIGGSGQKAIGIVVYIVLLLAVYFLIKLSYGLAFFIASKPGTRVLIRVAGIVVIAMTLGGVIYRYYEVHRALSSIATQSSLTVAPQK